MNRSSIEELSLEEIECIDAICDKFSASLKTCDSLAVEDAIDPVAEHLKPLLAMELIELEIEGRRQQGKHFSIGDYCERFPEWSDAIIENFAHANDAIVRKGAPAAIPGYEILGELGRGGMGVVYKARQLNLGRIVALKVAKISSDTSRNELERFRRETESAARLKHPNIVQIYDVGECEGTPFYTMEYIEGGNLSECTASSPLTPHEAARLLELLVDAVAFAHEMGIVHRDLKPSNILLQASPTKQTNSSFRSSSAYKNATQDTLLVPKLTDFGLAKRIDIDQDQTQTGTIIGTPSYMAPELIESGSKAASARADVYSLGVILYEAIVGRPPFRAATMLETLEMARSKEPIPPSRFQSAVPRDLETICLKCLEKSPENRYANATELGHDLSRFINGMPITARPIGPAEHVWRWAKRKPGQAGLLCVIAALFTALIVVPSILAFQLRQAVIQADEKKSEAVQSQRLAEARSDEADRAKLEAIQSAVQSQSRLVGMRINAGIGSTLASDPMRTLLWYEKAWNDDTYHSRSDREHRLRLSSTLARSPQLEGLCIHTLPIHEAKLHPMSGHVLIRDAKGNVSIWDPFEGNPLGELNHGMPVVHAAFDRQGTSVATCGGKSVKIWQTSSRQLTHDLVHEHAVTWMCFHPKNDQLLTASEDRRVRLWDLKDGSLLEKSWFTSEEPVVYVQFSPQGTYSIVIDTRGKLSVLRFEDRSILLSNIDHPLQTKFQIQGMPQFLQREEKLVTYSQKKFVIWDLNNRQSIAERNTQSNFRDFRFLESGERAVVATGTSLTRLFRISRLESFSDAEVSDFIAPRQTATCAITQDGRTAAVSSSGGLINVVNVEDGKLKTVLRTLDVNNHLEFVSLPGGKELLFVASDDGTIRLWNLNPKSLDRREYQFDCGASSMTGWVVRGDERALLSPDASIELRVKGQNAHLVDRKQQSNIGRAFEHPAEIAYALLPHVLQPGSKFVVADTRSCVLREFPSCDTAGPAITGKAPIQRVRLSHDGKRLLVWHRANIPQIWDTENGVMLLGDPQVFDPPSGASDVRMNDYLANCQSNSLNDIDLSPDGTYVTVRFDRDAATFAFRTDDGSFILKTDQQIGVAAPTAFAIGAKKFLVCNSDTRARVWNVEIGKAAGPLLNHPTFVRFGCLNSDASLAATWSADGKLRLWNPILGDLILESQEPILGSTIWFRNDSQALVVLQRNGSLFELPLTELRLPLDVSSHLVQLFCCESIDFTDGVVGLPVNFFRDNPQRFLNAWRSHYKNRNENAQPTKEPILSP